MWCFVAMGAGHFLMMRIVFIFENCQGEIEETLQNTPLERSESRASRGLKHFCWSFVFFCDNFK